MTTYTRAQIGLRAPNGGGTKLDPDQVIGVALHWPAMGKTRLDEPDEVMRALRGWQDYHQDDRGWSDIGYQVAVDQAGNRYELRGLAVRSGANGNTTLNRQYVAILLVVGAGEQPSPELIAGVQAVIADARRRYPDADSIVGHSQIRPEGTACPGPAVQALIHAGAFQPGATTPQSQEDVMTPQQEKKIDGKLDRNFVEAQAAARRANMTAGGIDQVKAQLRTITATLTVLADQRGDEETRAKLDEILAALDLQAEVLDALTEAVDQAPSEDVREAIADVRAKVDAVFAEAAA